MFLNKSFLFNLLMLARLSHAKKYLVKRLKGNVDPYTTHVLSKDKQRSLCIWAIQQIRHRKKYVEDDLYVWKLGKEEWVANLDHIHGLYEYVTEGFDDQYGCDCKDKVVLDIGGYIGDTARYFLKRGAQKVVVYEPVAKNVRCLKVNVAGKPVEVIEKGVGQRDGKVNIASNYPPGHIGFGDRGGQYQLSFNVDSFSTVLNQVKADIAKVDCEGNEKYLLDVEQSELCKIAYWMVEIHSNELIELLADHFKKAGFQVRAAQTPSGHHAVYHYARQVDGS